jgi:hypothetical protein
LKRIFVGLKANLNPPLQMNPQTATTTTFDDAMETLGKSILSSYTEDEHGAPVDLDPEQLASITTIIETVKDNAQAVFKPLYDHFLQELSEQKKTIDAISAQIDKAGPNAGPNTVISVGDKPTVDWLLSHRKSKKDAALTGYNVFTMWSMAKNKSGFPARGTWANEDQKFYKSLADDYNRAIGAMKGKAGANAVTDSALEIPILKGKGKAVTAFNVWTKDYMSKNPGAGFPPKGLWAQVSKEEVAKYQAQAKAIQAQRA